MKSGAFQMFQDMGYERMYGFKNAYVFRKNDMGIERRVLVVPKHGAKKAMFWGPLGIPETAEMTDMETKAADLLIQEEKIAGEVLDMMRGAI